jgi:hypothetical protein
MAELHIRNYTARSSTIEERKCLKANFNREVVFEGETLAFLGTNFSDGGGRNSALEIPFKQAKDQGIFKLAIYKIMLF